MRGHGVWRHFCIQCERYNFWSKLSKTVRLKYYTLVSNSAWREGGMIPVTRVGQSKL
jgi:hypothetical protein